MTMSSLVPRRVSGLGMRLDQVLVTSTFSFSVYPEPVYDLEKEVTPRTLKRAEVRETRANKYRNMF